VGQMADKDHVEPLARILGGGGDFVDGGFGHGIFYAPLAAGPLNNGDSRG
jgi:hypothetical protein